MAKADFEMKPDTQLKNEVVENDVSASY